MSTVDENQLKQEIAALLVSAKGGLSERQLSIDYGCFNGDQDIPYKQLGFPNLLSMLKSWPDICQIKSQGNQDSVRILAVAQKNTKHILSMVKQQKSNKSRQYGNFHNQSDGRPNDEYENMSLATGKGNSKRSNNSRYRTGAGQVNDRRTTTPNASYLRNDQCNSYFSREETNQPHRQPYRSSQATPIPVKEPRSRDYGKEKKKKQSPFGKNRNIETTAQSFTITVRPNSTASSMVEFQEDEESNDEDTDSTSPFDNNIRALLTEYHHGIRLKSLDELYRKKFGRSLLQEMNLPNILLIQTYVEDFATISRQDEGNDSCDHIITLKDKNQLDQESQASLREISDSGIVPSTFTYNNDLVSHTKENPFQGIFCDIDANRHYFYIRPNQFQEHFDSLKQELNLYYSDSESDRFVIKDIERIKAGLSCVMKHSNQYRRVFIESSDNQLCRAVFVDYGSVETINKHSTEFKHLLEYFAQLPRLTIACRLDGIQFSTNDQPLAQETCRRLSNLLTTESLWIEYTNEHNGRLAVRIFDDKKSSLSDYLLQEKIVEVGPTNLKSDDELFCARNANRAKSSTSIMSTASVSSIPNSNASNGKPNASSYQCEENDRLKWIKLDETRAFYLIRHENNHVFLVSCDLARLLRITESDVLSETLLPRVRLNRTKDFQTLFDAVHESSSNFLFIFDVISVLDYLERFNWNHLSDLKIFLRKLIEESKNDHFWRSEQKQPSDLRLPPTNQSEFQRYNELLTRRKNILCNMFRTTQLARSAFELESIENELRLVIEKMRHGAPNNQQKLKQTDSTATASSSPVNSPSTTEKDKLKISMERCKTLINTILSLDNYVVIEDYIIDYIEEAFSTLNAGTDSTNAAQLHEHYEVLLTNLTLIVNDLQQKLPIEVHPQ